MVFNDDLQYLCFGSVNNIARVENILATTTGAIVCQYHPNWKELHVM